MICFEPVQVSTAFSQLSETYHNKGCDQPHSACTLLLECRRRRGARMPTSFGGRRIYTSWGVTLFCPTCAEQMLSSLVCTICLRFSHICTFTCPIISCIDIVALTCRKWAQTPVWLTPPLWSSCWTSPRPLLPAYRRGHRGVLPLGQYWVSLTFYPSILQEFLIVERGHRYISMTDIEGRRS